jgi:hypothetical protein
MGIAIDCIILYIKDMTLRREFAEVRGAKSFSVKDISISFQV